MFNLKQFFMQKKNLFASAFLCASMFLFTGCDKIMSHFDNAVDSHLQVADKLTIIGVGDTYQITKDVDYKTISDAAPEFTVDEASKGIVEVDKTTGAVKALKSGDARIKISLPDNGLYLDASAVIDIKVRVQNGEQFEKDLTARASDETITIFLGENAQIDFTEVYKTNNIKFPVNAFVEGVEGKPATITMGKKGFAVNDGLTIKNVNIKADAVGETLFTLKDSKKKVLKTDGKESTFAAYAGLTLQNMTISFPSGKNFVKAPDNSKATQYLVDNCIIEIAGGNSNIFNLQGGFYDFFTIHESTLYSIAGHTGGLIKSDGKPKNLETVNDTYPGTVTTTLDHVTMYQIAMGRQMNNSNGNMKGQKYLTQILTNCILVNSGNAEGNTVKGWLFGQASTTPTRIYDNNTYWTNSDYSSKWITTGGAGDESGTVIKTFAGFKDAANGDFTIVSGVQKEKETGDPRWLK